MHELEREGYVVVIRSAGSHGAYDLVAFPANPEHQVLAVQCKKVESEAQAKMLVRKFKADPPMLLGKHFQQRIDVTYERGKRLKATL